MEASPSFDRYVQSELGWLRTLALQLIADAAAADDAVQETVVAALRRRPALDGSGRARGWLAAVLRRNVSYALRGARNRAERERRSAREEAQPAADEVAARAESQRWLADAVFSLSEPYRSVVLLRFIEGLEPSEIAARRGVPAATIRSQLSRALAELRATLDRRHGGDSRAWCVALLPSRDLASGLSKSAFTASLALLPMRIVPFALAGAAAVAIAWFTFRDSDSHAESSESVSVSAPDPASSPGALVEPPAIAPQREVVVASEASTPAPTRARSGLVVDRRTAQPVPHYLLEISDEGVRSVEVETDAEGRFEISPLMAPGPLTIVLVDLPEPAGRTELDGMGLPMSAEREVRVVEALEEEELRLEVDLGPVVPLAFRVPAGLTPRDFEARISRADPRPESDSRLPLLSKISFVRGGDEPFARFPHGSHADTDQPSWIELRSLDGLHAGVAPLEAFVGEHPGRVWVELAPTASLTLELELPAEASGVHPEAAHRLVGRARQRRSTIAEVNEGLATLELSGLAPGKREFEVKAPGCETLRFELDLGAGPARHRERLIALVERAVVRGELRSESGRFRGWATLTLSGERSARRQRLSVHEWIERDGRFVAPFEFPASEPGRHRLEVQWPTDHPWSGAPLDVVAPCDDVVLTYLDATAMSTARFELMHASTGARISPADATITVKQAEKFVLPGDDDAAPVWSLAPDVDATWSAYVEGQGVEHGRISAEELRPGVELSIDVAFTPGFRHVGRAMRADDGEPVAGVEIYFDGVLAGRSDADGRFDLRAARRPERIEHRASGWKRVEAVAGGEHDVLGVAVLLARDE